MTQPNLPPVGDEDRDAVESTIRRLARLRKRETAQHGGNRMVVDYLSDAINSLHDYGHLKGWWKERE